MRVVGLMLLMAGVLPLAGCETPQAAGPTPLQKPASTTRLEAISAEQSLVRTADPKGLVIDRFRWERSDRYYEIIRLKERGDLFYVQRLGERWSEEPPQELLPAAVGAFRRELITRGIETIREGDLRRTTNPNGTLHHIVAESSHYVCFVGAQHIGPPQPTYRTSGYRHYFMVFRCVTSTHGARDRLEGETIDFLRGLRFAESL